MSDESNDWVEVGYVARPHGIRGELRVKLHNPDSEILFSRTEVLVRTGDSETLRKVKSARPAADGIALIAFEGTSDRDAAEALRSSAILVPRETLPDADENEFYVHDILGAQVIDEDGVTTYGRVIDYVTYPSADVIVVQGDKRYEVPVIDDFVRRIDTAAKSIVVQGIDDFETT